MNSAFNYVALDRIRYSLVWEDHQTLYRALDIGPADHVLVITSAGCNVLNALLKDPARVTAVDLNPVQNQLLLFKQHVILHHDYTVFRGVLGLDGTEKVAEAWSAVKGRLPAEMEHYWSSFFEAHPEGLLTSGKLEAYITGFYTKLEKHLQQKLHQLIQFEDIDEQRNFFMQELHPSDFRPLFIDYFSDENLSRGRDPKLYAYTEEKGGESFYQRLLEQAATVLFKNNFYFRFFFFGSCNLPQEILPPCYQRKNFTRLKKQMPKLRLVTGEAVDILLSNEGQSVTKASLSNIFEYTSHEEFDKVCRSLFKAKRDLTLVFWNLLHEQGGPDSGQPHLNISRCETGKESCFYFKNVRRVQCSAATSKQTSTMTPNPLFSPVFIERLMQDHAPESNISVKEVQLLEVDNSASILAVLTAGRTDRLIGHFGLQVHFEKDGRREKRNMVMKIKPHGREIVAMLDSLAAACGGKLADVYHQYRQLTGFQHTHLREQEIYKTLSPSFTPEIYGVYTNAEDEVYIILMEYLQEVELLNSVMTPEKWSDRHIKKALVQMAQWHAGMLNKTRLLDQSLWDDAPSREYMNQLTPLWTALLENAAERFPDLYTPERNAFLQRAIETIPQRWSELEKQPLTLVHNDLNPRNTCFKLVEGHLRFCAYDWELSTFHVPQYDVAEFLSFVLDAERYPLRSGYLEFYRKQLHQLTGCYADKELFKKVFRWAALDFGLHRIGMYMMAHTISPYPFLPRVVNSFFDTVMVQESVTA